MRAWRNGRRLRHALHRRLSCKKRLGLLSRRGAASAMLVEAAAPLQPARLGQEGFGGFATRSARRGLDHADVGALAGLICRACLERRASTAPAIMWSGGGPVYARGSNLMVQHVLLCAMVDVPISKAPDRIDDKKPG